MDVKATADKLLKGDITGVVDEVKSKDAFILYLT